MEIKAKFEVGSILQLKGQKEVKLSAVVQGSEENKSFSKYTPSGNISIFITKETPAYDFFEVGEAYYLTFEKEIKE